MKFTTEMLEKAKTAKTAEELLEFAKAENVEMTAEEAEKYFVELHKTGELSDEELDNAAGGSSCLGQSDTGIKTRPEDVVFLYQVGQYVEVYGWIYCTTERRQIVARKVSCWNLKGTLWGPQYGFMDGNEIEWYWQNQIEAP